MVAMSFNAGLYDPTMKGPNKSFPIGKNYVGMITDSNRVPNKNGTGDNLELDIVIADGPLKGHEGIDRLSLLHPNAMTVKIANNRMAAYCDVLGIAGFNDTSELHNKPFRFDVSWQKGNEPTAEKPEGGYTEVTMLYAMDGRPAGATGGGAKPAPAAPIVIPAQAAPAAVVAASPAPQAWQQNGATPAPAPAAGEGWKKA